MTVEYNPSDEQWYSNFHRKYVERELTWLLRSEALAKELASPKTAIARLQRIRTTWKGVALQMGGGWY